MSVRGCRKEKFGDEVASLVESVTKIGALKFKDEKEYLASNHRKIFHSYGKGCSCHFD